MFKELKDEDILTNCLKGHASDLAEMDKKYDNLKRICPSYGIEMYKKEEKEEGEKEEGEKEEGEKEGEKEEGETTADEAK
mmetsp:Transcript_12856/g.14270  ORF Transcript_12856/g.14270 Transcript_12856/m.14270 type:complete len:80 (-) Transcript_12856:9-248(-)